MMDGRVPRTGLYLLRDWEREMARPRMEGERSDKWFGMEQRRIFWLVLAAIMS